MAEGTEGIGHLADVSRSGLYVRSAEIPRPGAIVVLQFESPTGKLVDVRGQVAWGEAEEAASGRPSGFGVRLHEPPREYREFVAWALAECEKGDDDAGADPEGL